MNKCYKHPDRAGIRYYGKDDIEQIGNSVPPVCDECMEALKKVGWYMDNPEKSHKHIDADKCEWTIVKAKEYLQIVNEHFKDTSFYNYIDTYLAGDFAVEIARLIYDNTDIRKPEPEKPLIVKSGNTDVAYYQGIDYLCIDPDLCTHHEGDSCGLYSHKIPTQHHCNIIEGNEICLQGKTFIPFSEIELTDEIALLRPMIYNHGLHQFVHLSPDLRIHCYDKLEDRYRTFYGDQCRLATAKELSDGK